MTGNCSGKYVSDVITPAVSHGYFRPPVVCCATEEAEKMRTTLEDFFYGSINPSQRIMVPDSELYRATTRVTRFEGQLTERLGDAERAILTKLAESQHEVNSITARENFILGFRLGARMMAECMDDNDGDIREITD